MTTYKELVAKNVSADISSGDIQILKNSLDKYKNNSNLTEQILQTITVKVRTENKNHNNQNRNSNNNQNRNVITRRRNNSNSNHSNSNQNK